MDCGLLRVTRARASEQGWLVCVVTRVIINSTCLRDPEPGLSDSESGHASGVTAWAGLAFRSRRMGEIYSAPELEVLETTNRYNENDGVTRSKRELRYRHLFGMASECDLGRCE